ncbi:hypothetical protein B0J13DRAFT_444933 [Dactylonectria estremocensis]|uniref:Uncharacterized protein n=1 Tax=Dactylonectria estremocensis TaxID=1079267 RepID=A0A9P9ERN7_9HYPO|nr:hypothetical protein B0J13DRAFT_444933 [Dactylonectria estremocensis]
MAHHHCPHPVLITFAIIILIALTCVLTVPKTVIALSSEHWIHFFPAWEDIISTILKKKNVQVALKDYRDHFHKNPRTGYEITNLVLGAFPEFRKSEMASASVILGLAPALLQQLSPTYADTAELAICRPVLAFMIAAGSPAVGLMDPSNCINIVKKLEDKPKQGASDEQDYARIEEGCKWTDDLAPTIIWVFEYVLAAVAIANSLHLAYSLGVWAVCSFAPSNTTLPSVWCISAVLVHLFGWLVLDGMTLGGIFPSSFSLSTYRDRVAKGAVALAFCLYVGCAVQALYGTLILSSLLFISVRDATFVVLRYIASALICRLLVFMSCYDG